jgi:hypothetical protein
MSLILFLIIIVMGIMWHCEPNMMRDMVAKSKIVLEKAKVLVVKCKKYVADTIDLFKYKG